VVAALRGGHRRARLGVGGTGYRPGVADKGKAKGKAKGKGTAKGEKRPPGLALVLLGLLAFVVLRTVLGDKVTVPEKLTGDIGGVHDPTMVKDGDTWYVFSTGWGIPIRRSSDLSHWENVGSVFPDGLPKWAFDQVPGMRADEISGWAPDVSKVDGRWHLYWSIGVFGTSRAVIGHATNVTLDPADSRYEWVDGGAVVASGNGSPTMAIDPNAVTDGSGDRWLAWGSFGHGIMLRRVDPASGKFLPDTPTYNLARRDPFFLGIEGAHLVYRDGWWWLFASFGFCCRGVDSSYSIHVGRSRALVGPYLDEAGVPMTANGGTTVTGSYANVVGPGHGSVVANGDDLMLVTHYYNRNDGGRSTLLLRPLVWGPDGWPVSPDAGFDAGDISDGDALGQWHLVGYPEEGPAPRPKDATVTLQDGGRVAPSGTWSIEDDVVHIRGVQTAGGVREWWLLVDPDTHLAFGRDNTSAAIRAIRS